MSKSLIMALIGSASVVAAPVLADCPEDLETLEQEYQEALSASPETVLSNQEITEVGSLRRAAQRLYDAGEDDACAAAASQGLVFLENARAPRIVSAASLKDRDLANRDGEGLGEIEDVAIDPSSGQIAYLIVDHGGFAGVGADFFALPWALVRDIPSDEANEILVDLGEEKLEKAPRVDPDTWQQTADRNWGRSVHEYFGLQPYWQQESGAARYLMMLGEGAGQQRQQTPERGAVTGAAPTGSGQGKTAETAAAGDPSAETGMDSPPAGPGRNVAAEGSGLSGADGTAAPAAAAGGGRLAPEIEDLSMKIEALTQALAALREQQRKTEDSLKQLQGRLDGAEGESPAAATGDEAARPAVPTGDEVTGAGDSNRRSDAGTREPASRSEHNASQGGVTTGGSGSVASDGDQEDSTTN